MLLMLPTAFFTPKLKYLLRLESRNSAASNIPFDAPEGTDAIPVVPSLRITFAHTVGNPLESKTS